MKIDTLKVCSFDDFCAHFNIDKDELASYLDDMVAFDADWNLVSIVRMIEMAEEHLGMDGLSVPDDWKSVQVVMPLI